MKVKKYILLLCLMMAAPSAMAANPQCSAWKTDANGNLVCASSNGSSVTNNSSGLDGCYGGVCVTSDNNSSSNNNHNNNKTKQERKIKRTQQNKYKNKNKTVSACAQNKIIQYLSILKSVEGAH